MTDWQIINDARAAAHAKHGENSIEAIPSDDPRWLPILVEEVGEVAHALTYDATDANLRAELIDVLSVASAWLDATPCPTCSGLFRETVGLVCQTCGTNYGDQGGDVMRDVSDVLDGLVDDLASARHMVDDKMRGESLAIAQDHVAQAWAHVQSARVAMGEV